MREQLEQWARERGYRVAWGPAQVVADATAQIEGRRENREFEEAFFAGELASVVAAGGQAQRGTVVMVAVPRPAHLVRFEMDGGAVAALLPPTYVRYRGLFEEVRRDLAGAGLPGCTVEHLAGPLKATAACLGLVRYGRNNVTYAEGLGSYFQLCAFITDAPLAPADGATLREAALLDECVGCGACAGVCPTGAIDDERVLLAAHRCLTHANEMAGPWPEWVPTWAHTCLLGCLECQKVCPVNPPLPVEDTGLTFSARETQELLSDSPDMGRSAESGVRSKLAWLGLSSADQVFGRNLRALAASHAKAPGDPSPGHP